MSVVVAIDGRVATCTLDRPERLNAIDLETYDGIVAFAAQLQADDDLWVGIITGAGDRAFSAGADLKKLLAQMEARGPGAAPPFVTAFAGSRSREAPHRRRQRPRLRRRLRARAVVRPARARHRRAAGAARAEARPASPAGAARSCCRGWCRARSPSSCC